MAEDKTFDFRLQKYFSMVFSGPSGSGKTNLVIQLIRNREEYINGPTSRVIFCYQYLQPEIVQLKREDPNIILTDSITEAKELVIKDCLLVIDDKQTQLQEKSVLNDVTEIFIRGVKHMEYNCVLLVQSLFHESLRVIMNNSNYLAVFNSPRNKQGIGFFGRQMSPDNYKYVLQAFRHACFDRPYCYIFIDYTMMCPERWRICSSLYPDKDTVIYSAE